MAAWAFERSTEDELMSENKRLIASFVSHGGKWYYASTGNRNSSSALGGRFSETLVYEYDKGKLGAIRWETSDREGSIEAHLRVIERIHRTGSGADEDE